MGKQNDEKQNLTEEIYMSGHGLDWEDSIDLAEQIFNANYRKQSDTAREIFAEIGKILTAKYNSIQAGYHHRMRCGNVDTPQGMKELGELSGVRQVIAEIKAFEKNTWRLPMEKQIDRKEYCKDCDRSIYATGHLARSCDCNVADNGYYNLAGEKCYCKIVNGKRAEKYPWEGADNEKAD